MAAQVPYLVGMLLAAGLCTPAELAAADPSLRFGRDSTSLGTGLPLGYQERLQAVHFFELASPRPAALTAVHCCNPVMWRASCTGAPFTQLLMPIVTQMQAMGMSSRRHDWTGAQKSQLYTAAADLLQAKAQAMLAAGRAAICERRAYKFQPQRDPMSVACYFPA